MFYKAKWLAVPETEYRRTGIEPYDTTGRFAYYRLAFRLPGAESEIEAFQEMTVKTYSLKADISASSRYRLWVNGTPVLSGPCKGDEYRQYYEMIDLSDFLVPGDNVIAAQVLYNDPDQALNQTDERAAIFGVRGICAGHRFVLEGAVKDTDGKVIADLTSGIADWRVRLENGFYLIALDEVNANLGAVSEHFNVADIINGWKMKEYICDWPSASEAEESAPADLLHTSAGITPRYQLKPRPIPLLYERLQHFTEELTGVWNLSDGSLTVPAHRTVRLILNAGEHLNAYPVWKFIGGRGARVSILYSEKFENEEKQIKESDCVNGMLKGMTDTAILDGSEFTWEPFWVRTFRYVQVDIETADDMLTIGVPEFRRTGYPLTLKRRPDMPEEWQQKVWDICLRTLGNCMLETYMDCPFYEQMQFPMDTRLQILFTYAVSGDTRLARKTITDYHCSMLPDGLIPGKYPSSYCQVISTFSLHYMMPVTKERM